MASSNKNLHLTLAERSIIETGCTNASTKAAIARTLGKDKSTIGKEIDKHRILKSPSSLPRECAAYKTCKHNRLCSSSCPDFIKFKCSRRDRSPGVCNGCSNYRSCRFNKYYYHAANAQLEYESELVFSRIGINTTLSEIKELGNLIKPLIDQGQSLYAILENHPEIDLSVKTLYNYIESGVFENAGVSIKNIDLPRKVRRKMKKIEKNNYKKRADRTYLIGRKKEDFDAYIDENPNASVVEMDTVYNDISNGPFMQTFKFLKYDLLVIIYHERKEAIDMYNGILLLESLLGPKLFQTECEVILTDRGSEFTLSEKVEMRDDGTRRTRMFYCDPMASSQKGSVENIHSLIRRVCPKGMDLRALGLDCQDKANRIASHINSYPKKKLDGKSSIQVTDFFCHALSQKLKGFGADEVASDKITLKPYLLK